MKVNSLIFGSEDWVVCPRTRLPLVDNNILALCQLGSGLQEAEDVVQDLETLTCPRLAPPPLPGQNGKGPQGCG